MAVNKVIKSDGTTLIDITGTTATANAMLSGCGAYGADGTWIDGTINATYVDYVLALIALNGTYDIAADYSTASTALGL